MSVKDTQARLKKLHADHAQAVTDRETARARERELAEHQRSLADQIAAVEQAHGDALALEELRSREDRRSAVAACHRIAATMPDPVRAQKFSALADELTA